MHQGKKKEIKKMKEMTEKELFFRSQEELG